VERLYRLLPALACVVVGAASFALSYVAISEVAAEVGAVPARLSWLVPVVVDGGVIGGSVVVWWAARQRRRLWFPLLFVSVLVVVSVVVNVAHASEVLLAQMIAALPPLVLLGTIELVAYQFRSVPASTSPDEDPAGPMVAGTPEMGSLPEVSSRSGDRLAAVSGGVVGEVAEGLVSSAATLAAADDGRGAGPSRQVWVPGEGSKKQRIVASAEAFVAAGGEVRDPGLRAALVEELGTSSAYVAKVLAEAA